VGEVCPGGFQGHLLIAVDRVVACPPELEPSIAALAEPLAVAMHAVKVVTEEPRQVRIIGYGPIASLVHREIGRCWPRAFVSVVEPTPQRRQIARAFGAAIEGDEHYLVEPAQLVVDAAGYSTSFLDAIRNCANRGTVLVVAFGHEPVSFVPAAMAVREITVLGANAFTNELPEAVAALTANPDRYRPVVTEVVLLEEAAERICALASSPSAGKLLVRP
jgi:(R,R)-butanediol dehydrogenase/meso-butanediol dehydrogenase/diacetyl reductase